MAGLEEYVRSVQLVETRKAKPTAEKTEKTGAPVIGRSGPAIIKPRAQSPFDAYAPAARSGEGADGHSVEIDVAKQSSILLQTDGSFGHIKLKCSDRDTENGRRIIEADLYAFVNGETLNLPKKDQYGSQSIVNFYRCVACQAEHGTISASNRGQGVNRSSTNGTAFVSNALSIMQDVTKASLLAQFPEIDQTLHTFAFGFIIPLETSTVGTYPAYSFVPGSSMIHAKVVYFEEMDRFHFIDWSHSSGAIIS